MGTVWLYVSILILSMFSINMLFQGYYGNKAAESIIARLVSAFTSFFIFVFVYGGLAAIVYFFAGTLKFTFPYSINTPLKAQISEQQGAFSIGGSTVSRGYEAGTAFILCLLTPLALIAAIFFGIFAGAGMAMMPLEMILSYFNQPTKPNAEEYVLAKKVLLASSERIIAKTREAFDVRKDLDLNPIANPVEKKMKTKVLNDKVNEMKTELAEFEEVFLVFKAQDNIVDHNPLVYLGYLALGIVFFIFSLAFIVHTFLAFKGYYVVLDNVFNWFAGVGSLLGVIVFLIVTVFVALSIMKGSIRLSGLLSSLTGILPFKLNATWTDAFLFNNQVLIASLFGAILYFAQYCPIFLRFTTSSVIFGQVIIKVSFVNFIFAYSLPNYLFMGFFLIGIILLLFLKSPKALLDEKVKEEQVKLEAEKERLKEMEKAKDDKKEPEKKS